MPALYPTQPSLYTLFERELPIAANLPAASSNTTEDALRVICAWPVSGQYGPGSRILYYVLVAACVVARKFPLLRDACLAAALLFPAIAAVHGIVLVALHVDGAVDLDIYGAFAFCAIGILTAPPVVRLSKTYWSNQGRNIIFLWTILILAGLLSLTVEFYRSSPVRCPAISPQHDFPYGDDTDQLCGMTCNVEQGPFSPMRQDSTNNIYVIPTPKRLTFGMGTLLTAACCVPAILVLVSIFNKIRDTHRQKRHQAPLPQGAATDFTRENIPERIDSTNRMIRKLLGIVEIPIFAGAVLAILLISEINFWSPQMRYMTEPIAAIGQWAPIAGTGFAVIGALYIRAAQLLHLEEEDNMAVDHTITGNDDEKRRPTIEIQDENTQYIEDSAIASDTDNPTTPVRFGHGPLSQSPTATETRNSEEQPSLRRGLTVESSSQTTDAGRARLARFVNRMYGTDSDEHFKSSFQASKQIMPLIPGERQRNPELAQQITQFHHHRASEAASAAPSIYDESDRSVYGGSRSREPSPLPSPGSPRAAMTMPTPTSPIRARISEGSGERPIYRVRDRTASDPTGPATRSLVRTSTLQVPTSANRRNRGP